MELSGSLNASDTSYFLRVGGQNGIITSARLTESVEFLYYYYTICMKEHSLYSVQRIFIVSRVI